MNQAAFSPPQDAIRLPHGSWLMKKTNMIFIPTGNVILKFAIDEIESFADIVNDIMTVLQSNSRMTSHVCESCGTYVEELDYEEPEGEDLA